ncbi:hypothetical protein KSP39_PZI005232 [Platanthera zijinensis]|uniref:Uncharacterized protein n=1 Tax=Platanthera zijinensis TaxID=2320716 RepID=A0AAP0GAW1_9ASPA
MHSLMRRANIIGYTKRIRLHCRRRLLKIPTQMSLEGQPSNLDQAPSPQSHDSTRESSSLPPRYRSLEEIYRMFEFALLISEPTCSVQANKEKIWTYAIQEEMKMIVKNDTR